MYSEYVLELQGSKIKIKFITLSKDVGRYRFEMSLSKNEKTAVAQSTRQHTTSSQEPTEAIY